MACLQKIGSDFAFNCATTTGGFTDSMLGKYSEAVLVNASDIASFTTNPPNDATVTRVTGTKGYTVQGAGNGISVTLAKIGGVTYPNLIDASVKLTIPSKLLSLSGGAANDVIGAEVIIALKGTNGYTLIGLGAPIVCTEIKGDSTSSEFVSVTFGVDEGQTGTTFYGITKVIYDSLKTIKV